MQTQQVHNVGTGPGEVGSSMNFLAGSMRKSVMNEFCEDRKNTNQSEDHEEVPRPEK